MKRLLRGINEFWFREAPAERLAVLRILIGAYTFWLVATHYSMWVKIGHSSPELFAPVGVVALLFGIVFTFTDLIVVFVLTRGGPYDTTQVLTSWAYFTGIQGGDLAGGAAISLFLLPVLVVVSILFLRFARRAEVA